MYEVAAAVTLIEPTSLVELLWNLISFPSVSRRNWCGESEPWTFVRRVPPLLMAQPAEGAVTGLIAVVPTVKLLSTVVLPAKKFGALPGA